MKSLRIAAALAGSLMLYGMVAPAPAPSPAPATVQAEAPRQLLTADQPAVAVPEPAPEQPAYVPEEPPVAVQVAAPVVKSSGHWETRRYGWRGRRVRRVWVTGSNRQPFMRRGPIRRLIVRGGC